MQTKQIILLAFSLCLAACAIKNDKPQEAAPIPVRALVVSDSLHATCSRYVGTIEAASETPLSMQSAGRVLAVYCKEGDRVRKGQVLLRIDSTQAVNALRSAEASLHHAQDGYNRAKQVHEKRAITDQKMVEIESQLAQARSLYQAARQQLHECTLVAPCQGVVSGLDIRVGQTLVPGIRIATILDISAYSVRFTVPEAEVGNISVNQIGLLECVAVNDTFPIVITERGIKANALAHTYEMAARIEGNTSVLMSGMIGKVVLPNHSSSTGIALPSNCILLMPQGATVWVAEQGVAKRRDITIGGYQADGVLVTEGLHPGDTVICEGYQKMYNGCALEIIN